MGAKIQAFDIFQTPLSSHYPLPLNRKKQYLLLKETIFYLKFLLSRWFSTGWGGGGWTGWVRRAVSLTTLHILKVLAHQIDIFWSLLTSDHFFLYMRKWFPDFRDAFSKSKIHLKFMFASLVTLICFKVVPEASSNFFVPALLLWYWSIFSSVQNNSQDHRLLNICIFRV